MENNQSDRFYYPQLDGLRFFAFLLVFIHNSSYIESNKIWKILHEYGWVGVDIFFCLSAFLVTKLLLLEYKKTKNISISDFYTRRALRIYPLYFLYILVAVFISYEKTGWDQITLQIMTLFTFTFNYAYIFIFPYAVVLFVHLWTISIEVQFYLIAPHFLKWIIEMPDKTKWKVISFLLALGLLIRALLIQKMWEYPAVYLLPFSHFESIIGGVIIGLGLIEKSIKKISEWILLLLVFLISYLIIFLPNINEYGWGLFFTYFFSGVLSTLLISISSKAENPIFSKLLTLPIFVYLGKISYGLYIFHLIGNLIIGEILQSSEILILFLAGLCMTFFLASLSYNLIEKHFIVARVKYKRI